MADPTWEETTPVEQGINTPEDFIAQISPKIERAAKKLGVDPDILLAQSALETGWGKHSPGNALFGIKGEGSAGSQEAMSPEETTGKRTKEKSKFAAYNSYEESVEDYVDFLQRNPRYKTALSSNKDPQKFINELYKAGYATDTKTPDDPKTYPEKVMDVYKSIKSRKKKLTPEKEIIKPTGKMMSMGIFPGTIENNAEPTWDDTVPIEENASPSKEPSWEDTLSLDPNDPEFADRTPADNISYIDSLMEQAEKPATAEGVAKGAYAVAENAVSMLAGFGGMVAAGATAIGKPLVDAFINRPADYLEQLLPLGEIDIGEEGIQYKRHASKKASIDLLTDTSQLAQLMMDAPGQVVHPATEQGKVLGEMVGEVMAPVTKAGQTGEEALSDILLRSDVLPIEIEGALVGLARAAPEAALVAAPIPISRGMKIIKGRKVGSANETIDDMTKIQEEVKKTNPNGPQPETFENFEFAYKAENPKATLGETHKAYAQYQEQVNLKYQQELTKQFSGADEVIDYAPPAIETVDETATRIRRQAAETQAVRNIAHAETVDVLDAESIPDRIELWLEAQDRANKIRSRKIEEAGAERQAQVNQILLAEQFKRESLKNKTSPIFEQIEARELTKQALEEDMSWDERIVLDEAARLEEMALDVNPKLYGMFKNQRGAIDIDVFAEALYNSTKSLDEFATKLVEQRGEIYKSLAPALYEYAKKTSSKAPKTVVRPYKALGRMHDFGRSLWAQTGGRAVDRIRQYEEAAPSFGELANRMEHKLNNPRPIAADFYEGVNRSAGKYRVMLEDILEPALKAVKAPLTKKYKSKPLEEILTKLRMNDFSGPLGSVVQKTRTLLDDIYIYAQESGIEVNRLENYVPRMYDFRKIAKHPEKFIDILTKSGIDKSAATAITRKIVHEKGALDISDKGVQNLLEGKTGKGAKKEAHLEETRMLKIPDAKLKEFLNNSLDDVLAKYIENVVHRVEWAKRFGAENQKLHQLTQQGLKELNESGTILSQDKISALMEDIKNLSLAMQKSLNRIKSSQGRAINTGLSTAGYIMTLPWVTLSSLTEPLFLMAYAPTKAAKVLPKSLGNAVVESLRGIFPKIPKMEMTRFAELNNKALDIAATERISAIFHGDATPVSNLFFRANGLHQWTRFVNIYSNEVFKGLIKDYLKDVAKSPSTRKQAILTDLGIDINKGIEWVKSGASETHPFFESVRFGAQRGNSRIVMHPRATVKPIWTSDPHYALIAMLHGWPITFGNTVMRQWYNMTIGELRQKHSGAALANAAKIAATSATVVAVSYMVNELRDRIVYGRNPPVRTDEEKVFRAIERSGFLGTFQTLIDAPRAKEFGGEFFDPIVGPVPSKAGRLTAGGYETIKGQPRKLARELAKSVPFLPKAQQEALTNRIEKGLK